jgi:hypothetical protein
MGTFGDCIEVNEKRERERDSKFHELSWEIIVRFED